MLFQAPRLKASFHLEVLSPSEVVLFDYRGAKHHLKGKSYVLIAKELKKGVFSLDEIALRLEGSLSTAEVYHVLLRMQEKGFVEDVQGSLSKETSAFCNLLECPLSPAENRLKSIKISPYFVGIKPNRKFVTECRKLGIQYGQNGSVDVVFVDNYRRRELHEFHRRSIEENKPWMIVKPKGPEIWVGPFFIPEKTPCFECFSLTLNNNHLEECAIEERERRGVPISQNMGHLPVAESLAISLSINEIFKWILQGKSETLEGKLISFNLCSLELRSHVVIKRLQCSSCFNSSPEISLVPWKIENYPVLPNEPEEIFERFKYLISPLTGIVGFLEPVERERSPVIHSYFAGMNLVDLEFIKRFPRSDKQFGTASGGKGATKAKAQASCLCEAIERHSGIYQGVELRRKGTYEELNLDAIDVRKVLLFSDEQYASRDKWNQSCQKFQFVPDPFDPKEVIDWSPIWSLTENRWKWIPTAFCYYNYHKEGNSISIADSNGCAAGNTMEDAILSGLFELIERDGIALWWYLRLKKPELDLSSFSDPYIPQLVDQYMKRNRKIWVLDLTTDLSVPVFAALSSGLSGEKVLFGFGAHLDPEIALVRALTEMNQLSSSLLWTSGQSFDPMFIDWFNTASLMECSYLVPSSELPKKTKGDFNQQVFHSVLTAKEFLANQNLEMLVLDQTRSYINMPVARVVVPGLRHFWKRLAPGRLYDVPLKMGWTRKKVEEKELNPISFFL